MCEIGRNARGNWLIVGAFKTQRRTAEGQFALWGGGCAGKNGEFDQMLSVEFIMEGVMQSREECHRAIKKSGKRVTKRCRRLFYGANDLNLQQRNSVPLGLFCYKCISILTYISGLKINYTEVC